MGQQTHIHFKHSFSFIPNKHHLCRAFSHFPFQTCLRILFCLYFEQTLLSIHRRIVPSRLGFDMLVSFKNAVCNDWRIGKIKKWEKWWISPREMEYLPSPTDNDFDSNNNFDVNFDTQCLWVINQYIEVFCFPCWKMLD